MRDTIASGHWWWSGIVKFCGRLKVVPFNVYAAGIAIWTGVAGLFNWSLQSTAFNVSLSPELVLLFNLLYVVSGVLIFCGLGWDSPHFEGLGLVLLLMSTLVRAITTASLTGVTDTITINIVVYAILTIPACMVRFRSLWKGEKTLSTASPEVITSVEELPKSGDE